MNTFENEASRPFLIITSESRQYLAETAKWGKFLAILGYITVGLMALGGIVMITTLSHFDDLNPDFNMSWMGYLYLLIALFYYFPVRYLHRFSEKISKGIASENVEEVTLGFENLKSLFKFMGIATIVIISLYILMILGMIIFFAASV